MCSRRRILRTLQSFYIVLMTLYKTWPRKLFSLWRFGMHLSLDLLASFPPSSAVGHEMRAPKGSSENAHVRLWESGAYELREPSWWSGTSLALGPCQVSRWASPPGLGTDTEGRAPAPAIGSVTSTKVPFIMLLKPPALFLRWLEVTAEKEELQSYSACLVKTTAETDGPGRWGWSGRNKPLLTPFLQPS